jgi:hypothetical protein
MWNERAIATFSTRLLMLYWARVAESALGWAAAAGGKKFEILNRRHYNLIYIRLTLSTG